MSGSDSVTAMAPARSAQEWAVDDPAALPAIALFLGDSPLAMATFGWTCGVVAGLGPATVRLTTAQVALRRRIGFAWLWLPGRWLAHPDAEIVLSIGLRSRLDSPRFKEVVEPYPGRWMHHLEVHRIDDLDDEAAGWLAAAFDAAG
jgi:hypothetical protein